MYKISFSLTIPQLGKVCCSFIQLNANNPCQYIHTLGLHNDEANAKWKLYLKCMKWIYQDYASE